MHNYIGITLSILSHLAIAGALSISLPSGQKDFGAGSEPIIVRLQKSAPSKKQINKETEPNKISPSRKTVTELPKGFDKLIKKFINPEYPIYAIKKSLEGKVVLDLIINKDGTVAKVSILSSSGHQLLDDSALQAAREWKFEISKQINQFKKEIIFKLN